MKQITKNFEFTDFKGITRPVFASIVVVEGNSNIVETITTLKENEYTVVTGEDTSSRVSIGLSICHESDLNNFKPLIGMKQAEGRAASGKHCALNMLVNDTRFFNMDNLDVILNSFIADFKAKPGKYIKGYNEYEEKYLKLTIK